MKYAFVCTNYNNSHFTERAVETLLANAVRPQRIIVVDNASDAEEQKVLRRLAERYSQVEIIFNPENVGYSAGLNVGIRHASATCSDLDLLVIGNNDLEFPADFSRKLDSRLDELQEHFVVCPNILTIDGVRQNPHAIRPVSRLREVVFDLYYSSYLLGSAINTVARMTFPLTRRRDNDHHDRAGYIYIGLGACYILSRKFMKEICEIPSETFLLYEEFFIAHRLAERGQAFYYEPDIVVVHHDHGSVKSVGSRTMWSHGKRSHRKYRAHIRPFGRNPILPVLDALQSGRDSAK